MPYQPSSPYAASKSGADHLVRAWHKTYGLPTIISNCSNNFGPYQCPEKFIPVMILSALKGQPMPIYGRGENVRDWLFVDDHARALSMILRRGRIGDCYNVGAGNEMRNIDVAGMICDLVDELAQPLPGRKSRRELMTFVADRPGHDARYAVDAAKFETSSAGNRRRRSVRVASHRRVVSREENSASRQLLSRRMFRHRDQGNTVLQVL